MQGEKLLLHICCAPDSTVPWPELAVEGWSVSGFLYGGNIHPREEYEKRVDALRQFAVHIDGEVHICGFDDQAWRAATKTFANEPEGGGRCPVCFRLQLAAAAAYAAANGYTHLSTTLTISPHKDPVLVNRIGCQTADQFGLVWLERIWRCGDGFKRSVAESNRLGLYRQNYCGCIYSRSGVRQ